MSAQKRLNASTILMIVFSVAFIAVGLWAGKTIFRDSVIAPWRAYLAGQGEPPWMLTAFLLVFFTAFLGLPVKMVVGALRGLHKSEEAVAAENVPQQWMRTGIRGVDRYRTCLSALPFPAIMTRPGRQLPFLLASETTSAQKTKKSNLYLGISLAVIGVVAFAGLLGTGSVSGALMTLPLLAAAVFVMWPWIRPLLARALLDPAVEMDRDLVTVGQPFRVFVQQPGPARITRLAVRLLCTEHITYTRGTDTYHETREVNAVELGEELAFDISQGSQFTRTFEATIPADSMHSFESGHNRVEWSIRVEAEIVNRPDVKQTYPFAVLPAA